MKNYGIMHGVSLAAMAIGLAAVQRPLPIFAETAGRLAPVRNVHRGIGTSRYMPHQGKREIARRLRQAANGGAA